MYNYELHKLYDSYEEAYSTDPYKIISFVKENEALLHRLNDFDEVPDFKKYMVMMGSYVKALVGTGRYNQAIDEALLVLPVIEKNMIYLNLNPAEENWYLSISFQKGYAHFQLKDYSIALKHFKILLNLNPDSDEIKTWMDYAFYGKYKRYTDAMLVIASILIVGDIFFGDHLPHWLNLTITCIGILLIGINYWIGYLNKKNRRVTQ